MQINQDILIACAAVLIALVVTTAGPLMRAMRWRRSIRSLDRWAWQNTINSLRTFERD